MRIEPVRMNKARTCAAAIVVSACVLGNIACSKGPAPEETVPRRGGLSPREAVARMQTAPGFSVKIFASEPEVRQPVAMNWDDRGRMWVVEYIQYPDPAGLKALEWDRYFRTRYDRVPDPPPDGPRGADRIRILEDRDGDGRADRFSTFVDGLNLASGVAVGHGGVYVAQTPYLLFYPDRDRNDVPDGPPEVLLRGFGMEDAHAVVNSLTWGPDGWLYGAQGSTVTARIRGHTFQQGIWRFHPTTHAFELFAEGGGNTWSFDWDEQGHLLCGTNWGKYALLHMVQGGYYVKTFEKHGPLSNPYAFGYIRHAEHRGPFKGGHVTIGGLTYQADRFPGSFRGKHIAANILSNVIYWYEIEPVGSTFATRLGGELLNANDQWFRPVDLTTGPDGALYVADWYDVRATHNNTREDTWDKGSGRIYRIDYGEKRGSPGIRLNQRSSADLVRLLEHPNEWFHREARRVLAERRDASVVPQLRESLERATSGHLALEHLWALYGTGGFDEDIARRLLRHSDEAVRMWTVRFLGDARRVEPATLESLRELAGLDPNSHVRSQLASAARRLPGRQAIPIIAGLIRRGEDDGDLHNPLLVWWAMEEHFDEQREVLLDLLAQRDSWKLELVRNHLAERAARRLAAKGTGEDFADCVRLLRSAAAAGSEQVVLAGIDLGLAGRAVSDPPAPLIEALAPLWRRGDPGPELIRLSARLGLEPAGRRVREIAADARRRPEERVPMIDLMGQLGGSDNLRALTDLLARPGPEPVTVEILKALGRFSDPQVATVLIRRMPSMGKDMRQRSLEVLVSRKEWAARLLRILGEDLRREPVTLVQKILQHNDPELQALVEKHWGRVHAGSAEAKAEMIRNISGSIGPVDLFSRPGRTFDKERGKKTYEDRCSKCHSLFGQGGSTGPDLTGADRRNIELLITNIVDPSASIRGEYASFNITLKDGRKMNGVILDPTPESFQVADAQGEKTVVARADVLELREASVSLMPEGLLDDLDRQGLADFFFYLTSTGP